MIKDIILKNRNNETVIYSGVSKLEIDTNDGGKRLFTDTSKSTVIEDKLVEGYTAYNSNGEFIEGKLKEPSGLIQINANGIYNVKEYETANVNIPTEGGEVNLQEISITENGEYNPSEGYAGFSKVIVNITSNTSIGSLPIVEGVKF